MDPRIITTADRPDLDEQGKAVLLPGWPEFIFHDEVSTELIGRAAIGLTREVELDVQIPIGEGPSGRVLGSGEALRSSTLTRPSRTTTSTRSPSRRTENLVPSTVILRVPP